MMAIESILHLIGEEKFDNVLGVHLYDTSQIRCMKDIRLYQLIHNTMRSRILCIDAGEEILISDNSYMTSFLDNLALVALTTEALGENIFGREVTDITKALGKKFFAEQLFVLGNSDIARTLFLENIIEFDATLRQFFENKEIDEDIQKSSDRFTAFAADFLRNHEIGHVVNTDPEFKSYVETASRFASEFDWFDAQKQGRKDHFIEEVASDIFAINIVMNIYAPTMSGISLKSYLRFLICAIVRMHVLYDLAADTHRIENDPSFDAGNIDDRFSEWATREAIMNSYVDQFEFGPATIVPAPQDAFIPLSLDKSGLTTITAQNFAAPSSINSRRIASLVSAAFVPDAGFERIIEGTRPVRVLDRR